MCPLGLDAASRRLVPATPEFATTLRDWTHRDKALLVVDEVITFRSRLGGMPAAVWADPRPHGAWQDHRRWFPVGAVAGSAEVMSVMDPGSGRYLMPHSGTFSANLITMTAGLTAMELFDPDEVERVNKLGQAARAGIGAVIDSGGFEACVTGTGSMFRIPHAAVDPARLPRGLPPP